MNSTADDLPSISLTLCLVSIMQINVNGMQVRPTTPTQIEQKDVAMIDELLNV